ncbi:MAG: hypothetical protein B7Z73_11905 [Planctomycetia bacterium 21-64-5]|nr:MAG: hypothetical protein B7Z73_11905 [Planctomycetia bacterium 21-64-5]HQU43401.1 hypothetical protein [Pirellulales bacterium]
MGGRRTRRGSRNGRDRAGAATLDYALLMGVVLPMAAFCLWAGPRLMRQVYEMLLVCISWPFL